MPPFAAAELHLSHAEARIERAVSAQEEADSLWSAELTQRSLPVFPVARLREWLVLRDGAMEASALAEASAKALRVSEDTLDGHRRKLANVSGQSPQEKSCRELLDHAEATLKASQDNAATFDRLKSDLRRAEDKAFAEGRKVERNLAETRDWQVAWKQAVAKAHLDEGVSAAKLDTVGPGAGDRGDRSGNCRTTSTQQATPKKTFLREQTHSGPRWKCQRSQRPLANGSTC